MRKEKTCAIQRFITTGAIGALFTLALVLPLSAVAAGDDAYPGQDGAPRHSLCTGRERRCHSGADHDQAFRTPRKQVVMEYHSGAAGIIGTNW